MGAVLAEGQPADACVNQAIAAITADGQLQAIYDQWIKTDQEVPFLE